VSTICEAAVQTVRRWEKNTPIPSDKLSELTLHGFDAQYILSGVASANLEAVSGRNARNQALESRVQCILHRLSPTQKDALISFLETVFGQATP